MGVRRLKNRIVPLEMLAVLAALVAWNVLSGDQPGFPRLAFVPYWLPAVVFASFYGPVAGLASLALGVGALPVAAAFMPGSRVPWAELAGPQSALVLLAVGAIGFGRSGSKAAIASLRARYRELYKKGVRLSKTLDALRVVNGYYERELLSARDSLPLIHEHLRSLDTRSVEGVAGGILTLLERFAGVRSAALYRADSADGTLQLVLGAGDGQAPAQRPLEGCVEGWVHRNGSRFTIRQVLDDPYLASMDDGGVIMAFPLAPSGEPWGVLTVRDLPFVAYTESTERAIEAMLELARPYLDRAVRYERLTKDAEFDQGAGVPSYAQFMAMVDEAFGRGTGSPFSVVICQIDNLAAIVAEAGPDSGRRIADAVSRAFSASADTPMMACQYKRGDQLGLFVGGLDEDGVSRLSLEALGTLQMSPPDIGGQARRLDLRVGFASRRRADAGVDEIIGRAELLIELQG
ncbi:MAG: hypothetical protein KBB32_02535 [Spirochaetia bacterium]|nr:hypothetical protein [Spirochaetia bacterium]